MLFGKTKLELKVGTFIFVGLVILVIFVLSIGGLKTWALGYNLKFSFNFINGVKIGAPVRFAGVDVGKVKEINFVLTPERRTLVVVEAWVKDEVKIPVDSVVWINTLGLLGEKYIEVMPGENPQYLRKNETLAGNDPVAMHEVTQLAKNIADDLDAIIAKIKNGEGTIGKLVSDDTLYKELEALVLDLQQHPWKLFFKGKEKPAKK